MRVMDIVWAFGVFFAVCIPNEGIDRTIETLLDNDSSSRAKALSILKESELSPADSRYIVAKIVPVFASVSRRVRRDCLVALELVAPEYVSSEDAILIAGLLTDGKSALSSNERRRIIEIVGLIGTRAESSAPLLQIFVESEDVFLRYRALAALARIQSQNSETLKQLQRSLTADAARDRWLTADALGFVGSRARAAAPMLRLALNDSDPRVRVVAANAVWKITEDASIVVTTLIEALSTSDIPVYLHMHEISDAMVPTVRELAVHYLGQIGPKASGAVPALAEIVANGSGSLRYLAVKAIGRIDVDSKEGRSALENALKDEDRLIRTAAQNLLEKSRRKD